VATGEHVRAAELEGSYFSPPKLRSIRDLPAVAGTVLFRPHLGEAGNAPGMLAAVEGAGLVLLSAARWRRIAAALVSVHRQPFLGVMAASLAVCIVVLSPLANFGLLVRERTPILPLYLMLLCAA
jgi:hypothetical protein